MKLPKAIWSQLGPVPVLPQKGLLSSASEDAYGIFDFAQRRIRIEADAAPAAQMSTLFHEITHVALEDSGAKNLLDDKTMEAVCDALGAYLAGAALAGWLRLSVPK